MDFSFTEDQETVGKVARELFERRATPDHLSELEAGDVRFDAALWRELAGADLLGIALPEAFGGSDGSFLDLGVLLAEVGRAVAPVPLYATLVLGADTIARHGSSALQQQYLPGVVDGSRILTGALTEPGRSDPTSPQSTARRDVERWRLDGAKHLVPAAQLAGAVVVSAQTDAGPGLFVVDTDDAGVDIRPVRVTNGEPHADISLDGAVGAVVGEPGEGHDLVSSMYTRALVGLCAMQIGIAERALRLAASYTTEREQFGRPIGSFQAVQQRMADAFIDVESIRWTTWHAAWLVAEGRSADRAAGIAKFWASEAGARVTATAQQVHGGMGIDVTYPLSRYYLWAKQIELSLGSASHQLARLGSRLSGGKQMTSAVGRNTLAWNAVDVGDELTAMDVPVTTTLIVAGAIASRDYMPVHHDRDFAKSQGSPDIFMNILTTNGLCVKFLHDWAGPEAMIKKLSIRLGVPAYPNDPLTFTGTVTGTSAVAGEGLVDVSFTGANSLGNHVTGTAVLSLLDGVAE